MNAIRDAVLAYTDAHPAPCGVYGTSIPGLTLFRGNGETALQHTFFEPAFIVVVQGTKDVLVGSLRFSYSAGQYLILSAGLPTLCCIRGESDEQPYLSLAFKVDLGVINDLMDTIGRERYEPAQPPQLALSVQTLEAPQANALNNLSAILANPEVLSVLYPSILRELLYWTLTRPVSADSTPRNAGKPHAPHCSCHQRATCRLPGQSLNQGARRVGGDEPLRVPSPLKASTSMSPLQYQKQLRLVEARRLMRVRGINATNAAYQVGYESVSQFTREYARAFGAPPHRDNLAFRRAV